MGGNELNGTAIDLSFTGAVGGNAGNINSGNTVINLQNASDPQTIQKIAKWVSPLDFSSIQSQALEKQTPGTLLWFINSPQFRGWRTQRGGAVLWCPGPPGAGKTVFASFVIDQLQRAANEDDPSVSAVCYVYCQYNTRLSVLQTFGVLLKQLILTCPSANIDFVTKMKSQSRRLPLDEIITVLQTNFTLLGNVFVVVDALDECFTEPDRNHLVHLLRSFKDVKVLITSRDLPSIERAMEGVSSLEIWATEEDIRGHVQLHRRRNPQFMKLADRLSTDVSTEVAEKAAGSFLLADLHTAYLAEQTTEGELVRALHTLPVDATASHASALGRINQQKESSRRIAYSTLSVLSYAVRTLTPLELQHAVTNLVLGRVAGAHELNDLETLISATAGLVTSNRYSSTVGFIHYTVQEYLEETRENPPFPSQVDLTQSYMSLLVLPGVKIDPPNHPLIMYVASTLGHYVRRCEYNDTIVEMTVALLTNLAIVNILASVPVPRILHFGQRRVLDFSGLQGIHLAAAHGLSRTVAALLHQEPRSINRPDSNGRTPLSWAAGNGQFETVGTIIEHDSMVATKQSLDSLMRRRMRVHKLKIARKDSVGRTPLSWAAGNDHSAVVELLLKTKKAKVDATDADGCTALSWAAIKGNHQVVETILLTAGNVDIDVRDVWGETPLSSAVQGRHLAVVKVLFQNGRPDPNLKDRSGSTPLSYAAKKGDLNMVEVILSSSQGVDRLRFLPGKRDSPMAKPVNLNCRDSDGRTPLYLAATGGHLEVVKMLLDTGRVIADIPDRWGRRPLLEAAKQGRWAVVKALLDSGKVAADIPHRKSQPVLQAARPGHFTVAKIHLNKRNVEVNRDDHVYRTLLVAAAAGNSEVVTMLLNTGKVNANASTLMDRTPLLQAARRGHWEVVKILLDSGKVDLKPPYCNTVLLSAAGHGQLEVVKALLDTGKVNANVSDGLGGSPLSQAAKGGHWELLKMLLTMGQTDYNSQHQDVRTVLSLAVRTGRAEVVNLILSLGVVDIDSCDRDGKTPLCWAAAYGHSDMVQLLLESGEADVDGPDLWGQTPLSIAASRGHISVVKILLKAGVNVHCRDDDGQTPLLLAAKSGHSDLTKMLLDTEKVDVNLPDYWGRTPLSHAAEQGRSEVVKMLLGIQMFAKIFLGIEKVNINSHDRSGQTPLSVAARNGHSEVVKLLLDTETFDVNERDRRGRTALSLAAQQGHSEVVKLLLFHSEVDVNSCDHGGQTSLHWAMRGQHLEVIKILLDTGKVDPGSLQEEVTVICGRLPYFLLHKAE